MNNKLLFNILLLVNITLDSFFDAPTIPFIAGKRDKLFLLLVLSFKKKKILNFFFSKKDDDMITEV